VRSIRLTFDVAEAPYTNVDRVFHRLTCTASEAVNIPAEVFVVDTSLVEGKEIYMYPATPADLQNIGVDNPTADGLLRVLAISIDLDNMNQVDEFKASIQARVALLIDTLNRLDETDESFSVVIGE
jgi:uncharacterized protein (UPF0264 family)